MTSTPVGLASAERRYAVHDVIGAGGMATVHLGRLLGPMGFSRAVAIKRLHPQYALDPDFTAMFLDEGRIASRIHHPNVVSTIDVVCMDGELLLVMEYVDGESLSKLLDVVRARGERVPVDVAAAIASGILHGLHAAHCATGEDGEPLDLVHRDVSPQNVLVGSDGVTRVMDFGIAKATGRLHTTRDGQLRGKMAYLAPEQLRSGLTSPASDVWGASVVLWEMLTGESLFAGGSDAEVFGRVLYDPITPVSSIVGGVPDGLDRVIVRGLERFPDRRFGSAEEMALAIEHAVRPATPSQVGGWVHTRAAPALTARGQMLARVESEAPSRVFAEENAARTPLATRSRRKRRVVVVGFTLAAGAAIVLAALGLSHRTGQEPAAPLAQSSATAPAAEAPTEESEPSASPAAAAPTPPAPARSGTALQLGRKPGGSPSRPRSSSMDGKRCYTVDSAGYWHVKPECL